MNAILHQKRNVNFFITVGLAIALVIVAVFAIATSTTMTKNVASNISQDIAKNNDVALEPISANAFPQYHQSEWNSIAVTNNNGLETYYQSERTLIPAQAGLLAYYLSERTLVNPLAEYLASERTLSPIVNADFSQYHLSERAMTVAIAIPGLSQYVASERTSILVQFTPYQLSEWFDE